MSDDLARHLLQGRHIPHRKAPLGLKKQLALLKQKKKVKYRHRGWVWELSRAEASKASSKDCVHSSQRAVVWASPLRLQPQINPLRLTFSLPPAPLSHATQCTLAFSPLATTYPAPPPYPPTERHQPSTADNTSPSPSRYHCQTPTCSSPHLDTSTAPSTAPARRRTQ